MHTTAHLTEDSSSSPGTLTPTPGGVLVRMQQTGFRPDEERNYQGANYSWQRFIGGLEQVVARLT